MRKKTTVPRDGGFFVVLRAGIETRLIVILNEVKNLKKQKIKMCKMRFFA